MCQYGRVASISEPPSLTAVRPAAIAGMFYPAEPEALLQSVRSMLAAVDVGGLADKRPPKAIIAPHAGYIYSGPIAASVYARLAPLRQDVARVVLLGPAHRVAFGGIAVSGAEAFETPLGRVPLDREAAARLLASVPGVVTSDEAHAQEHSLEVHLPFLQTVFDRFTLLPLVVGGAPPDLVARVLEAVWGGPETLVVISSDLSHYLDYGAAQAMDRETCAAIERLDGNALTHPQACGRVPVAGILDLARRRGMSIETLDLRNSGDTAGPRDRVVGYGAWALTEPAQPPAQTPPGFPSELYPALPQIARQAIQMVLADPTARPTMNAGAPQPLLQAGAVFVTLKRQGQLRGCIGSPIAWRPLAEDLIDNAIKAATQDPRFPPVGRDEFGHLTLSVSLLTPPLPMTIRDEADLLVQLRPQIDGLIIEDGEKRALFLPSVWEQLPKARDFLDQLKRKAGMAPDHWSSGFKASRFQAVEIRENKPNG